jgi:hypothetical protein
MPQDADVLIVCGQGVYTKGAFYTEYPDRDVYVAHALAVQEVLAQFRYSHVVCSGGFTQQDAPHISEARSFGALWDDLAAWPAGKERVFWDELSLDSAENVYLGLMAAREGLGRIPIRRVGVFAAWKFKKARFNAIAGELGLGPRLYFHGLASAEDANAGRQARQGELAQVRELGETNDMLMLGAKWEAKRLARYRGPDYRGRLMGRRGRFEAVFQALDHLRLQGASDALRRNLQDAFRREVLL